jgi:hypothetical protein
MSNLRLMVRSADPLVMENIQTLQKDVTISGTVNNPKFHGHPLTLGNLQYWLSFADWTLMNDSAEFSGGKLAPSMSQEDVVKSIQRGFDDFCRQSKVRGERSDFEPTPQKTHHYFAGFNR